MTGAELVIKLLQQHGVDSIFGYPGGAIMPIYDALYGSSVKHYLCRHEQAAPSLPSVMRELPGALVYVWRPQALARPTSSRP